MGYTINAACISHPGHIRLSNEDNFYFNGQFLQPDRSGTDGVLPIVANSGQGLLFAVFDGMGGENYGELASFAAAKETQSWKYPVENPLQGLEALAQQLNDAVLREAHNMLTSHMGTTMVALCFFDQSIAVCNVGDSKAYLLRENKLLQISQDHIENPTLLGLRVHRKPSLSQYLGVDPEEFQIEPYFWEEQIFPGDQFLLSSDGLTDMVSTEEIGTILEKSSSPDESAEKLVEAALSYGGKDNITVIVCTVT